VRAIEYWVPPFEFPHVGISPPGSLLFSSNEPQSSAPQTLGTKA
jgi:hypothetical protein